MAATVSDFACVPLGRNGQEIQGCFVDADLPCSSSLPVSLRIFFDPDQNLGFFRLRAAMSASREPFFLDISPDNIQSLSLRTGPPSCLHLHVTTITLIAPQHLLLHSITDADRVTLDALRSLAQQKTVRIVLPNQAQKVPQLGALCEAVGRGGLRLDPGHTHLGHTHLQSLYQGKGGRVVQSDEDLGAPSSSISTAAIPNLPPPDLFSVAPEGRLHPPAYSNRESPDLAQPPPPRPHTNKRQRRTPSFSSSSSPDYRTWKHLDLAVGDREKMMTELLRRAGNKERTFRKVMDDLDAKCADAEELIAKLTALTPKSKERKTPMAGGGSPQSVPEELGASQISTASPSPSASASAGSNASVSSNISDHIQAYITKQFDQLRQELAENYATNESVQRVSDEVDHMLNQYVEEYQMVEAIQDAIDEAIGKLRARLLEALV